MAEVRKAVREDKYGTAKIKKETKENAKSEKKAVKKNNKRYTENRYHDLKWNERVNCLPLG